MKKTFCLVGLLLFVSISIFSIGLTYGPVANEQYVIENDGQFPLSFYDFPLFIGGIYHKIKFSDTLFYYVDLAFNMHNGTITDYAVNGIDINNYILYLHNDINLYPFNQKWVYVGAGMELIVIDRIFSEEAARQSGYNFYVTTNYFCYINGGINIPIGKMEIGFKTLYRLLPFSFYNRMGNGEITLLIGLK
ncbi:MAG: hypothetical protein LBQ30_07365 [Treponema sp.]|jgi:hypothetical protein|nr:hypothetical protein [Treponema sp.]